MSIQVSYKKQFAIYFIFLLIIIVAVEGILRFYEFFVIDCTLEKSEAFEKIDYFQVRQMCFDIRLLTFIEPDIIQHKPNQHYSSININSHGFRGEEFTIEPLENTYRIFIVGGSTTFGIGSSSDNTTIPGYLQKRFDNESLDVNVEIINAGINGLYSFSETYHIKKNILKFKPNLIINYGGSNDSIEWVENPQLKTSIEVEDQNKQFKFKNYSFYRTPFVIFTLFFENEYREIAYPTKTNPHDKILNAWKTRWLDICALGYDNEFKTMILVQPALGTGNKFYYSTEELELLPKTEYELRTLKILESMANELKNMDGQCDFVGDLRNTFDYVDEPIYFDFVHVTDRGNEIVADKIFDLTLPIVLDYSS